MSLHRVDNGLEFTDGHVCRPIAGVADEKSLVAVTLENSTVAVTFQCEEGGCTRTGTITAPLADIHWIG